MTTLLLNGIAINAHRPASWGRAGGVVPVTTTLELDAARADAIYESGQEVTLTLDDRVVSKLHPLQVGAGTSPYLKSLVLADRRWLWPYRTITLDVNLRRRTGNARLVGPRVETSVAIPEVDYAPHSLSGLGPASPRDALDQALGQLVGGDYLIEAELPTVDLEDVLLAGPGHAELARLLSHLPGVNVEITDEGRVRVYNDVPKTAQELTRRFYALDQTQVPRIADRRRLRPRQVHVRFVVDAEVRVDFQTPATTTTADAERDKLTVENVVRVAEPSLLIPSYAGRPSRTVGYGTWVTLDEYLQALLVLPRPVGALPLTQLTIRKHWLQGFSRLKPLYTLGNGEPDPLWMARLETVYSSWRQTFRVNPRWRGRLFGLRTERIAVYDTTTATHAPSVAYCDYNVRSSWRGLSIQAGGSQRLDEGWNIRRWTEGGKKLSPRQSTSGGTLPALPAPFEVKLEDAEAFVLRLVPGPDPHHEADQVAPGTIDQQKFLQANVKRFNNEREAFFALWEYAELEEPWSFSTVLTGLKGAPNGAGRYHTHVVTSTEAAATLGVTLGPCEGPVLELLIPHQLCTARFAWRDEDGEAIRQSFLTGSRLPASTCLVNYTHVRHVAVAAAARAYELYLDTLDGVNCATPFDVELRPNGALRAVTHVLDPDPRAGGLTSRLVFGPSEKQLDLWPLLPDGTRKALQHTVIRKE